MWIYTHSPTHPYTHGGGGGGGLKDQVVITEKRGLRCITVVDRFYIALFSAQADSLGLCHL